MLCGAPDTFCTGRASTSAAWAPTMPTATRFDRTKQRTAPTRKALNPTLATFTCSIFTIQPVVANTLRPMSHLLQSRRESRAFSWFCACIAAMGSRASARHYAVFSFRAVKPINAAGAILSASRADHLSVRGAAQAEQRNGEATPAIELPILGLHAARTSPYVWDHVFVSERTVCETV